ncbi:hydantoinase B/oxoprolinase family protein [Rouxiella badensis]|uniref:hydantoinase B/oxoprolinase family protein n=1 Tax=Rouxiella badensis TaxID=1646377 RepID=UPI0022AAC192|nr:hydantoinase B/oxoprolinase family protein [Rouxiella badensis]WAT09666.1 hydantoinase B/oxoprolinase family protein [Rouxiella badensis]
MTTSTSATSTIDPATLAVIANRVNAILREMTNTLLRSGRSAILTTARDFSCSIVTADNRLLATAEGLPVHIFGSHLQTATMSNLHKDIEQGDAFLHNDPYNGNTHAADHTILVPVFIQGKHLFTAVAKAHQADIGNSFPTTYMPMAKDVYEEGALIFTATRIQRNYEDVQDIIRLCRMRIRVPDQWYGDYLACLGSARIGERRLTELAEKYGLETIQTFVEEWFAYSERRIEHAIKKMKSGTYEALTHHDPLPGIIDESIPVKVVAKVDADEGRIVIDLQDNIDCLRAGINMSRATSTNCAVTGIFNILDADMPHNHGTLQRIDVKIRENCIVGYPVHPTSCSMATSNLADRVINATQTALSSAGSFGLAEGGASLGVGTSVIAGKDSRRNNVPYVNQLVVTAMGGAASSVADGWLTMGVPVTGGLLLRDSIEVDEQKYPVHFEKLELVIDSGGAGKFRGGASTLVEYSPRFGDMTVAVFADSRVNPAKGTQGGLSGRGHFMCLKDKASDKEENIPSFGQMVMTSSQSIVGIDAGGGGYGSPLQRDTQRVLNDVLEGYVSLEKAKSVYGVAFTGKIIDESLAVDIDATRQLRA